MASSEPTDPRFVALTEIDNAGSFYDEGRFQGYCAHCSWLGRSQVVPTWEVHHVLSKQHCRIYHAPRHSPDNALRVCAKSPRACHERHTGHQELLPLACLRDENIAFIARWLGAEAGYEHLVRYYSGSDPRVDLLLT